MFFCTIFILLILGISHRNIQTLSILYNFYIITCIGVQTRQRPVWLYVLPANHPAGICVGRPICLQGRQLNRFLSDFFFQTSIESARPLCLPAGQAIRLGQIYDLVGKLTIQNIYTKRCGIFSKTLTDKKALLKLGFALVN